MKLIHVADIHIGATSEALLDAARVCIAEQAGTALVVSGDLTQRGSRHQFKRAREWVDKVSLPSIVVPGNHDTPLFHAGHRLLKPFSRYADHFGDLIRPLNAGRARLFPLNTARGWQTRTNWAEGSVNLMDLDALIAAEEAERDISIMVCHHPFTNLTGAGLRTRTRQGDAASHRLAGSRFQLLMTGHVHTPRAERIYESNGNYLAVSAGTLSHRLRSVPPSFNVVEIGMEGVTISPFSYVDGAFAPLTSRSFDWTHSA